MNWKEQFEKVFDNGESLYGRKDAISSLTDFISTEIIEKIIADIPTEFPNSDYKNRMELLVKTLKDKWLLNQTK